MALDPLTIQNALADAFFAGDATIAGSVIFATIMAVIFAIFGRRTLMVPFVIMLPATMIAQLLGLIPTALTIIIILVSVLVISTKAREAF